jgi:SDR family mycofactocin-dependent oxidoreductase
MTAALEGKVVLITGAARGQGRSHAIRFAEEGCDVIALDLCAQIDSVAYPMSSREDLDETINLVEKTGQRIVAEQADVRDFERLKEVVNKGVSELGRLDYILANAGIMPIIGEPSHDIAAYLDAVNVMLNGAYFTIEAALPALLAHGEGGAIVITSSSVGLKVGGTRFSTMSHGGAGYAAAKHGVVGLMRYYANSLAEKNIRVNSVHPTGVNSPMVVNEQFMQFAMDNPEFGQTMQNLLPNVPVIEASDVTEAMVYLCGNSGRYVTGITHSVDAGLVVK